MGRWRSPLRSDEPEDADHNTAGDMWVASLEAMDDVDEALGGPL